MLGNCIIQKNHFSCSYVVMIQIKYVLFQVKNRMTIKFADRQKRQLHNMYAHLQYKFKQSAQIYYI